MDEEALLAKPFAERLSALAMVAARHGKSEFVKLCLSLVPEAKALERKVAEAEDTMQRAKALETDLKAQMELAQNLFIKEIADTLQEHLKSGNTGTRGIALSVLQSLDRLRGKK